MCSSESREPSDQSCDDEGPCPRDARVASDARKSSKPIMEKRRRARINDSLNQLKALILDTLRKDSSRHSKLEKADILEMTVKHLRSLHRLHISAALCPGSPGALGRYRAGYSECVGEVSRFLSAGEGGLPAGVRARLLAHLADRLAGTPPGPTASPPGNPPAGSASALPSAALPSTPRLEQLLSAMASGGELKLVPAGGGLLAVLVPPAPARSPGASLAPDSSSSSPSPPAAAIRPPAPKEAPRLGSRLAHHRPQLRAAANAQAVWRPW